MNKKRRAELAKARERMERVVDGFWEAFSSAEYRQDQPAIFAGQPSDDRPVKKQRKKT